MFDKCLWSKKCIFQLPRLSLFLKAFSSLLCVTGLRHLEGRKSWGGVTAVFCGDVVTEPLMHMTAELKPRAQATPPALPLNPRERRAGPAAPSCTDAARERGDTCSPDGLRGRSAAGLHCPVRQGKPSPTMPVLTAVPASSSGENRASRRRCGAQPGTGRSLTGPCPVLELLAGWLCGNRCVEGDPCSTGVTAARGNKAT